MKKPQPPVPDLSEGDFDVFKLSPAELQAVEGRTGKWHCCINGCTRFARVKDFGVLPYVWVRKHWQNLSTRLWYCGKHWKIYRAEHTAPLSHRKPGPGLDHTIFKETK